MAEKESTPAVVSYSLERDNFEDFARQSRGDGIPESLAMAAPYFCDIRDMLDGASIERTPEGLEKLNKLIKDNPAPKGQFGDFIKKGFMKAIELLIKAIREGKIDLITKK